MGTKPIGLSASRAASVLGLNGYQSALEVWQLIMEEQKLGWNAEQGYLLPPEPDNASIRWGNAFEGAVISLAEKEQGETINCREQLFVYYSDSKVSVGVAVPNDITFTDEYKGPILTCHVDGLYTPNEGFREVGAIIHEGKSTSYFAWKEWGVEPPMEYIIQQQHQMICTGAESNILSALVFPKRVDDFEALGCELNQDDEGHYYIKLANGEIHTPYSFAQVFAGIGYFHQYATLENPELQKVMIDTYKKWWHDHIINENPPLEGVSYEDIKRLCPKPTGTIVCDEEVQGFFEKYNTMNKIIKRADERKDKIKAMMIAKTRNDRAIIEKDSMQKWLFKNDCGENLGSFDGKTFRSTKK